ncbi:hypothetical protein BVRB_6g136980 [Beta vulgaris subsp. vulgaris]|nr:hypothetical protein BVRB_6g136980 [Beta vulgaris subsp. vulgaris]
MLLELHGDCRKFCVQIRWCDNRFCNPYHARHPARLQYQFLFNAGLPPDFRSFSAICEDTKAGASPTSPLVLSGPQKLPIHLQPGWSSSFPLNPLSSMSCKIL